MRHREIGRDYPPVDGKYHSAITLILLAICQLARRDGKTALARIQGGNRTNRSLPDYHLAFGSLRSNQRIIGAADDQFRSRQGAGPHTQGKKPQNAGRASHTSGVTALIRIAAAGHVRIAISSGLCGPGRSRHQILQSCRRHLRADPFGAVIRFTRGNLLETHQKRIHRNHAAARDFRAHETTDRECNHVRILDISGPIKRTDQNKLFQLRNDKRQLLNQVKAHCPDPLAMSRHAIRSDIAAGKVRTKSASRSASRSAE